jgi:hypothetical protein
MADDMLFVGATPVHCRFWASSMVQVQLAKLKEETRCPMCFGEPVSKILTPVRA